MRRQGARGVSVVVPAYNVAPFLAACLESIFSQTYRNVEVIVVNDGSTDAIEDVIEPYRARLTCLVQSNHGVASARNAGIRRSSGDVIAFLDGDDAWKPACLEKMVEVLEGHRDVSCVSTDAEVCDETGTHRIAGSVYADAPLPGRLSTVEMLKRNFVFCWAAVRKTALEDVGLFDERFRRLEDWDLWFRMLKAGKRIEIIREPLAIYRRRSEALSGEYELMQQALVQLYAKVLQREDLTWREWGVCRLGMKKTHGLLRVHRLKQEMAQPARGLRSLGLRVRLTRGRMAWRITHALMECV